MALPCQRTCGRYREGCHKTCAAWEALQAAQARRREREKAFLRQSRELYAHLERQWRQTAYGARW